MTRARLHIARLCSIVVALGLVAATAAFADPCLTPNTANNTADLPPPGCQYLSPSQVHMIINGLPSGTQVNLAPIHIDFICHGGTIPGQPCGNPPPQPGSGMPSTEQFDSNLKFQVTGTGSLSGLNCTMTVPAFSQVETGPRPPGPVQSFPNQMQSLSGQVTNETGCGIFQNFHIRAGTLFGLPPSNGQSQLTQQPSSSWQVDSFFDIFYEIEFTGAPGGPLSGMTGTTRPAAPIHMEARSIPVSTIPTMSEWGILLTILLIATAAVWFIARRTRSGAAATV